MSIWKALPDPAYQWWLGETPGLSLIDSYPKGSQETLRRDYDNDSGRQQPRYWQDNRWNISNHPVVWVSWFEALAYIEWLNRNKALVFPKALLDQDASICLPREDQWEYAARGGASTNYWWGEEYIQGIDHCDRDLGGCPEGTELSKPGPAGRFKANSFGLFDVTSNLLEWVLDCYCSDHRRATNTMEARLDGGCGEKVFKGSSWLSAQPYVHIFLRGGLESNDKGRDLGFRVLREIKPSQGSILTN